MTTTRGVSPERPFRSGQSKPKPGELKGSEDTKAHPPKMGSLFDLAKEQAAARRPAASLLELAKEQETEKSKKKSNLTEAARSAIKIHATEMKKENDLTLTSSSSDSDHDPFDVPDLKRHIESHPDFNRTPNNPK